MNSSVTREFRNLLAGLPSSAQNQAHQAFSLWQSDPHHRSLAFKRISRRQRLFSVRVGIGHRALGRQEGDRLYWFWIGSHADYDQLIGRL